MRGQTGGGGEAGEEGDDEIGDGVVVEGEGMDEERDGAGGEESEGGADQDARGAGEAWGGEAREEDDGQKRASQSVDELVDDGEEGVVLMERWDGEAGDEGDE